MISCRIHFERALVNPPTGDVGAWLSRIAIHAGIDLLRQRRRRSYVGPWLPEPWDTGDESSAPLGEVESAAARYDLLESASFAFLIAAEALSPKARAVLLLCDVFDYSVREAASLLAMTETHVKVTHHRARRVMQAYDTTRVIPTHPMQERTRVALAAFIAALVTRDPATVCALLADDVRSVNDSDGKYTAARVPILGKEKVALFWINVSKHEEVGAELRMLNGMPALIVFLPSPPPNIAPKTALFVRLDRDLRISVIHGIVAPAKLARLERPSELQRI